jgi:hypothetical protein
MRPSRWQWSDERPHRYRVRLEPPAGDSRFAPGTGSISKQSVPTLWSLDKAKALPANGESRRLRGQLMFALWVALPIARGTRFASDFEVRAAPLERPNIYLSEFCEP